MADVRKTVEIALRVVGVDLKKIADVSKAFEKVQKSIDTTTKYVNNLQKTLNSMKVPSSLSKIVSSFKELDKIKAPNLVNIANGFDKLGKMKAPPDLSKFVKELEKFSNIKLSGISGLVNGLNRLVKISFSGFNMKITTIETGLKRLATVNLDRLSTVLKNLNKINLGGVAQNLNKVETSLKKTGDAAQSSGIKLRTFADKVRTVVQFRLISEGLLALKAAIGSGVTAIIEYDQALKDLQAITGATTLEVAQMGITILEVASTTKFSASEVAAGMRTIGQAGFSAGEAVETMQAVSDLATGTLSDMATTVDLVTTAMRVFQIDATESAMVADVFANSVNRSKLTIDKLRTAMNYIGPIARDSGVSFKELSAAMGTLANSGLRASTIGTGLRRVFSELIDPSKKLKEAANRAGVALSELDPRASSLSDVIQNLGLVVNDAQVAFDVFGKRGAAAVLALSGTGSRFQEMLITVGRSGIAAQQAAIQMEGLGVAFKNLKDKLGILAIALGKAGIADVMRFLIDITRNLVDVLTYLINTTLGNFIVKLALTTAAVFALAQAFKVLKATAIFTSIISGFQKLASLAILLETSVAGMVLAFAPFLVVFAALTAAALYFFSTLKSAKEAADEAALLSDEYSTLLKKMENYNTLVATSSSDSKELLNSNKALRDELFKVSSGYSDLSEEARLAALSINPLTGEINKNSDAIENYDKKLKAVSQLKLVETARLAGEAYTQATKGMETFVLLHKDLTAEAANTTDSYTKLKNAVAHFSDENGKLSKNQKELIEQFKYISGISTTIFSSMQKWGQVTIGTTVDEFINMAEKAEYSGIVLDGLIDQFKDFKKANEGSFSNIIEKWAIEGTDAVADFIEEYKELGGVFGEGEEAQLRAIAKNKARLASDINTLKEKQKAEAQAGVNIELTWKRYYKNLSILEKEAEEVRRQISESRVGQNIKLLKSERVTYEKHLAAIAVSQKDNVRLRIKLQAEATKEYKKKEKELLKGIAIDPKQQQKEYKENLQERETLFAKHLENLAIQESKGILTSEQVQAQKLESTVDFYKESYREALKYQSLIDKETQPEEFEKRHQVVLKAEEAYYKTRQKFLNTYNSEVTKSNEKLKKLDIELLEERDKNLEKNLENKKAANIKLLAIDVDYKDKKIAIEDALQKKLELIDAKIAANRKSASNDVLSLESSTEEKIRNIRKRGLTDAQKDTSDKNAANKYLREGRLLLAQADKEKDEEKLSRGIDLIQQAESLGQGLRDERAAVNLLKESLKELKKARNIEAEIAELDLLMQKEEEVAAAAAKQAKLKEAYDEKVQNATTAIQKIETIENERHQKEMNNLNAEISKYKKKIEVARGLVESGESKGGLQEITESINQENDRHQNELSNIETETGALMDKYETARKELEEYGLSQEELDMNFDEFFETLTGTAAKAQEEVKSIMEEEITVNMDNTEVEETVDLLDSVDNTILDVLAKVIGKNNVDALKASIDRLRDKTITITTRYVTQGKQAVRKATGGKLPGFGGGDKVPVLGEAGEWWINKFAVRKYGDDFIASINNMTLPKFTDGGKVGIPSNAVAPINGSSETLIVRFQAGGVEAPVKITDTNSRIAIKNMANELTKMRLIHAR